MGSQGMRNAVFAALATLDRKPIASRGSSGGFDLLPADPSCRQPVVARRKSRVRHDIEHRAARGFSRPKNVVFGLQGRDRRGAMLAISPCDDRFGEDCNENAVARFLGSYDFPSCGGGEDRLQGVPGLIERPENLMGFLASLDPDAAILLVWFCLTPCGWLAFKLLSVRCDDGPFVREFCASRRDRRRTRPSLPL